MHFFNLFVFFILPQDLDDVGLFLLWWTGLICLGGDFMEIAGMGNSILRLIKKLGIIWRESYRDLFRRTGLLSIL